MIASNSIKKALKTIDLEIELHNSGSNNRIGDKSVLEAIKVELLKMQTAMSTKQFYPSYDYILRDSYEYDRICGTLLDAYFMYEKL